MKTKYFELGTKKISSNDFKYYILNNKNIWEKSQISISENENKIINKYILNKSLKYLINNKNENFLKGYLLNNKIPIGEKIYNLPNGKKLARGGFSIFAKNLKLNLNEKFEWDISYENSSGTKTYLYNENKIHLEQEKKYEIVLKFKKKYTTIIKKLKKDISTKEDIIYIGLYLLIKTQIRIGNLGYFISNSHKGLTTLQKKDIKINLKKNKIKFDFIGKDGVPQNIEKTFNKEIIEKLSKIIKNKKEEEFIFINKSKQPIHSYEFSKILYKYTNQHFYPHIIRSYYANNKCENFLNNHKITTKEEIEKEFEKIAKNLGHKKYNKKTKKWEINSQITIKNYIYPKIVTKMKKLVR